jgi:hypothetical protein
MLRFIKSCLPAAQTSPRQAKTTRLQVERLEERDVPSGSGLGALKHPVIMSPQANVIGTFDFYGNNLPNGAGPQLIGVLKITSEKPPLIGNTPFSGVFDDALTGKVVPITGELKFTANPARDLMTFSGQTGNTLTGKESVSFLGFASTANTYGSASSSIAGLFTESFESLLHRSEDGSFVYPEIANSN